LFKYLDPDDAQDGGDEGDQHRHPQQIRGCRQSVDPLQDEFEVVRDRGEVGAGLIGRAERRAGVMVGHAEMLPDEG
jgi:hypothetical protein